MARVLCAFSYVGDGRFHLESIMIANPSVPAFRYDPYDKKFTREVYEHGEMREVGSALDAKADVEEVEGMGRGAWSVVLGTLGRQGNLNVLNVGLDSLQVSRTVQHAVMS
jgi:2-(3-amino-3-carboxypropyl)histidine synthase